MSSLIELFRKADRVLVPRGETRCVLVDGRTPMNYAMVAAVHRAMASDPRVTFYFTASGRSSAPRRIFGDAGPGARLISPRRASLMRFDAYLTSDLTWASLPRGTSRVQMFHGVAGKFSDVYDAPAASMRHWDRLMFVNARRMRNFVVSGAVDEASPAIRLIGMPKVDCLVDGSLQRDDILTAMRLDPALPTVLYAPTWTPYSSLNVIGESLVSRLAALPINFIVKPHDRSLQRDYEYSGGVDWLRRLKPMLPAQRAVVATDANICPYLAAADVMITDHSSAGFEYLLRNRPLIRIHVPELIQRHRIAPEYVELMAEAAATTSTTQQTIGAVEDALADPWARSRSRAAVAADLFYRPGTATYRAVREMYDVIELPAPATDANLLGAGTVLRQAAGYLSESV